MFDNLRFLCAGAIVLFVGACALPRGAAIQSEVTGQLNSETPTFQVVKVTRDITPVLAKWPRTGWHGHYHWLTAGRAPDSSLIRVGDNLHVVVWDNQENSLFTNGPKQIPFPPVQVTQSGHVFVPYVGDVLVRGLTVDGARRRIEKAVVAVAPAAQVQLSVDAGRNNSIDLVGGVAAPGRYPLESRDINVLSMIAVGGGVHTSLRHPLIRLQRDGKIYETRIETLYSNAIYNVLVRGGDQITVIEDKRSYAVLGASGRQELIYTPAPELI